MTGMFGANVSPRQCRLLLVTAAVIAACLPGAAGADRPPEPPRTETPGMAAADEEMSPVPESEGFRLDPVTEDLFARLPSPAPPETVREIENPYGIQAAWEQGDWVTRGTFLLLLIMSVATWYILFVKLWEQQRILAEARRLGDGFWQSDSLPAGVRTLRRRGPFRHVAERGLAACEHRQAPLTRRIERSEWVAMSLHRAVNDVAARLQRGLAVLATVGSTAPFVGLFGTVWGIYHALTAIGLSGQATIDKVAGPVGEALIMTALGLAVAVPAVWSYNWLVRRNRMALDAVRSFGSDLHSVMLGGGRSDSAASGTVTACAPRE